MNIHMHCLPPKIFRPSDRQHFIHSFKFIHSPAKSRSLFNFISYHNIHLFIRKSFHIDKNFLKWCNIDNCQEFFGVNFFQLRRQCMSRQNISSQWDSNSYLLLPQSNTVMHNKWLTKLPELLVLHKPKSNQSAFLLVLFFIY